VVAGLPLARWAQPERRILRINAAQTPYPEPMSPVITPAADPMNNAFAQSGQISRPVIVFLKGSRTRRRQSGHFRVDSPIAISSWLAPCSVGLRRKRKERGGSALSRRGLPCSGADRAPRHLLVTTEATIDTAVN
jgi:hypothetical protein